MPLTVRTLERGPEGVKMLETTVQVSGRPLGLVNTCLWPADGEPDGHIPAGPKRVSLEILIYMGPRLVF